MGSFGAIVMSFFGAVFAAVTLSSQFGLRAPWYFTPFVVFALIVVPAWKLSEQVEKAGVEQKVKSGVIVWSSVFEGVAIFIVANVLSNTHREQLLLP